MTEKRTSTAPVNLLGLVVAKQGPTSLAKHLCEVGESCASVQLAQYQQRAMLEQKRFESIVNSHS